MTQDEFVAACRTLALSPRGRDSASPMVDKKGTISKFAVIAALKRSLWNPTKSRVYVDDRMVVVVSTCDDSMMVVRRPKDYVVLFDLKKLTYTVDDGWLDVAEHVRALVEGLDAPTAV